VYVGLMLALTAVAGCRGPERSTAPSLNVLLVTIDTLRADRIGAGIAPTLDRLAQAGVRFTSARTAVPLTLPSHTTIHTGLLPPQHGIRENGAGALAPNHQTIAALLKAAGYRTAAFVGAFVLDRRFGLAHGFDVYDDRIPRDPRASEQLEAERPASAVVDSALAWFNQQSAIDDRQSPFFVWIHVYDPHAPYNPPAEFRARTRTLYDGEIAYADSQLARVFDALRTARVLDRTLVVIAGDHGEGLGEHGERTHGMLLYDSTVRVPLVVVAPGRAAATVDVAVSLSEVAPTILRAAGVTAPAEMKGRDLLTVRSKAVTTYDLYAETDYPRVAGWSPLQALTDGRWKTIRAGGTAEVYDLPNDPREEHDAAAAQPAVAAAMSGRAGAIHGSGGRANQISPDVQERLRALGYVASSATMPPSDAPGPAQTIGVWNDFEDALAALNDRAPWALGALKKLASSNPGAAVMQTTYARALKDAGEPLAALAVYRQAASRSPGDAMLLHDLAVAARDAAANAQGPLARSLRDEATRADRAALAVDPDSPTALNGLGLLAIDDHRFADAAQSFERAAALDPNNASYWTNLGNARRATGDRARAEDAYRRALDVDARAGDAANGLGVLLVEADRPAEAVAWFTRAIAAAPDLVEARLNLGIALQQSGQRARAAEEYRRVLASPGATREKQAASKLLSAIGTPR
jgi:choline-sulfatase